MNVMVVETLQERNIVGVNGIGRVKLICARHDDLSERPDGAQPASRVPGRVWRLGKIRAPDLKSVTRARCLDVVDNERLNTPDVPGHLTIWLPWIVAGGHEHAARADEEGARDGDCLKIRCAFDASSKVPASFRRWHRRWSVHKGRAQDPQVGVERILYPIQHNTREKITTSIPWCSPHLEDTQTASSGSSPLLPSLSSARLNVISRHEVNLQVR
jgi:hypothetical protein